MGLRLQKLIKTAVADGKITKPEVDKLLAEVKANGTVSKAEKKELQAALERYGSKFDAAAKASLTSFLGAPPGPPPPPPPPGQDPLELMTAKLTSASAGGLTGNELAKAETEIAAKYGAAKAKEVLETALGARVGDLTTDGVTWLQQKHGQMSGHIARYQQVLLTHLKDSQLLDANFDGKLDENDKIFTKDAAGRINVQSVGTALRDEIKIGAAMVDACQAMDTAGHSFALIKDQTFNSSFWNSQGSGAFALKPGVRPSDAVKDIFANPGKYKFECATALVIVHYKAILDLLGPKDFDEACKNLKMGPWVYDSTLASNWKQSGAVADATEARKAELRAGNYTYFKNWDVSPTGRDAGWQGENVISLGGDNYYGHPFGISTGAHIVEYLNQNRNAGSTRPAAMLDLQAKLEPSILQLDKIKDE